LVGILLEIELHPHLLPIMQLLPIHCGLCRWFASIVSWNIEFDSIISMITAVNAKEHFLMVNASTSVVGVIHNVYQL